MVQYSPVCDNSIVAYLAYLSANSAGVRDGTTIEQLVVEYGSGGGRESSGGGNGDGSAFVSVFSSVCATAGAAGLERRDGATVGSGACGVRRLLECGERDVAAADVGLAVGDVGGLGRSLAGSAGVGVGGNGESFAGAGPDGDGASGQATCVRGLVSDALSEADPLCGLTGRRRRKKKRAMRAEKKSVEAAGRSLSPVGCEESREEVDKCELASQAAARGAAGRTSVVSMAEVSDVPEWRRKDAKALVHKGYFSECSPEVRKELKETRAQMMIARNRAAVAKAKEEAVRSEAAVKSRQVEQQAELRRLQTEAKLKKALESKFGVGMQSGFAETVVSNGLEEVCGTPSLSDSSVSPNSSISVCAVRKMEQTIKNLSEELRDVKQKYDVLSGAVKKGCAGKEKSEEDYDGPISEAEYRRNCDIMYGMRPGATKPMDAKYDELMVKMCAEGFSALGTEDLNELQAYGEFYG